MKTLLLATILLAATPLLAAPAAISINREPQAPLAVTGASTVFRVTFDTSVTGVDINDFTLVKAGTVTGTVASVFGSGAVYDVTVNGISGFGSMRLDLKSSGTGIVDGSSAAIVGGYFHGQSILSGTAVPAGWGNDVNGQLGDGTSGTGNTKSLAVTTNVSGVLSGKNIVALASGSNFTVALTSDNLLYAWGAIGAGGQLGNGATGVGTFSNIPVAVTMSGVLSGKTIIKLAAGSSFGAVLDSAGAVYAWGVGTTGQLGDGLSGNSSLPVATYMGGALNGKTVVDIAGGNSFAVACTSDGGVYTWGSAGSGQLGNGTNAPNIDFPAQVGGLLVGKRIVAVCAGGAFASALSSEGRVYTWGANNQGQLGDGGSTLGSPANSNVPIAVMGTGLPGGKTIARIYSSLSTTYALATDGTLYAWGGGATGALGNGAGTSSTSPVQVDTTGVLAGKTIASLGGGNNYAFVLTTEGKVYGWGVNSNNQLGDGTTTQRNTPVAVDAGVGSALNGATVGFLASGGQPVGGMVGISSVAAPVTVAPTVTTDAATTITHQGATLGGNVTSDGGASVTDRGIVWATTPSPTTANTKVQNGTGTGIFSAVVNGMAMNTPIYVRAYATNSVNTSYGNEVTFTTLGNPVLSSPTATGVTATAATLGGTVTSAGGLTILERGVVFAPSTTNTGPTVGGFGCIHVATTGTLGVFTVPVAGLTPGTQYHYSAYAQNSLGYGYTAPTIFTTGMPLTVTSLNRVNPTPTNATTVNWTLTFPSATTGLTSANFTLVGAAAAGSLVGTPTTSNNITWNIPVTTGSTDGLLTLRLANDTGLSASYGVPFDGDSYTIDKTAPTVLSVTRLSPSGQNTNATTVTFRVTYSEPVALNAPAASRFQVVPVNGSNIVGTVTGVTGSTNTRDVTVNLTSGTGEFRLRVVD